MKTARRATRYSIGVGGVDLLLDGPLEDWRLECTRCPWVSSARGITEAVEWAGGHDLLHHRWRCWWAAARGSWLRW